MRIFEIFEDLSRRDFIKGVGATAGSSLLPKSVKGNQVNVYTDKKLQMKVLKQVLSYMREEYDPSIPFPKVVNSKDVDPEIFVEVYGFPLKRIGNHYHWKRNLVVLKYNRIDILAHELVHYVQAKYRGQDFTKGGDFLEMEAVTIENKFRDNPIS